MEINPELKNVKWTLLGASRGLGLAFSEHLRESGSEFLNISRSSAPPYRFDASKEDLWVESVVLIRELSPERVIYFAGGGPHGNFSTKKWSDHEWSRKVNFAFPAYLLHQILSLPNEWAALKQICFIGSSIAEEWPDAGAASYAAGKHALRGLVTSLQAELGRNHALDIRLFSPGYMDTGLLPENAWPRKEPGRVQDPKVVATKLLAWLVSDADRSKHKILL